MKASRILAGLSAVSLAASMLSMVAASADNPFTVDEGEATGFTGFVNDPEPEEDGVEVVSDTTGTTTETATASDYDFAAMWNKRPWYNAMGPVAAFPGFPGWPGWGFKTIPAGWEWIEFYKNLQNHVWEEFAQKDQDTAAAGYLVFEFEGGKKQIVPVDVDSNGQYVTDEFLVPFMNVQKVYFLYEVSEAPYFNLKLDAFNVNGKDVELNKDNAANGVAEFKSPDGADAIEGVWEEIPEFYQNTIFDKGRTDLVINHGLILWGTKVKVTFTVDGIGKYPVHPDTKVPGQLNDGLGDDQGEIHTHIDPVEAGDKVGSGQRKNLAEGITPVNPMYWSTDTRSADLYDALVDVYNSKDDHSADAEIRFKTIADNNGVLVANFLNVWEVDADDKGNEAHWLTDFTDDGFAIYVRKEKVHVVKKIETVKQKPISKPILDHYENPNAENEVDKAPVWKKEQNDANTNQHENINIKADGETKVWYFEDGDYTKDPIYGVPYEKDVDVKYEDKEEEHWVFDGGEFDGQALDENKNPLGFGPYSDDTKFLADDKTETAYCWHPYFITENGLVDVVTKNDLGKNRTNPIAYNALTDSQIKYMRDHNGMYYNDDIHSAAFGHFVVFGDNTLREYSYRIKSDAVKAMLEAVQRSVALRDEFIWKHGAKDIWKWNEGSDTAKFGPNNKLIIDGEHAYAFDKDHESQSWLDSEVAKNGYDYTRAYGADDKVDWEHHRAVHGAIWLQCCEGTVLRDVRVHAHTDIITQDTIPTLYGKENYDALFPKKPAESKADAASGAAAQPTADAGAADNNTESGAAAGFGIAGLLLAGAAMVCVKKKN